MYIDMMQREDDSDAKLARICPEAYEAKIKAGLESNPLGDLIRFLKELIIKKMIKR